MRASVRDDLGRQDRNDFVDAATRFEGVDTALKDRAAADLEQLFREGRAEPAAAMMATTCMKPGPRPGVTGGD